MTAHTPGPWQVWDAMEGNTAKLHVGIVQQNGSVRLASLPNMSAIGEDEANARLIAAAPEMLEALEAITGLIRDCNNVYQNHAANWIVKQPSFAKAEAAIHKARGGQ